MQPPGSYHSSLLHVSLSKPVPTLIFRHPQVYFSSRSLQARLSSSPTFDADCRLSGNRGLAWISATQAVGDRGGLRKGIPLVLFHWHTHTCLRRIALHFQTLSCLESGDSEQVHSYVLCDRNHITHNPQRSVIPRPALQEHIVTIGKGKATRSTLSKCKGSFFVLFFFSC